MVKPRTMAEHMLILVGSLGPLGHAPASGTVTVAVIGLPLFWLNATSSMAMMEHGIESRSKRSGTQVRPEISGFGSTSMRVANRTVFRSQRISS